MKNDLKGIIIRKYPLLMGFMLLWAASALAYDVKIDGVYYDLNANDKTASVTYYSYNNNSNAYTGSVVIPERVTDDGVTYDVTSIQARAFDECARMTDIAIPSSIVSIGDFAFNGCTALTSVSLPNSVIEIGPYAFCGCTGLTTFRIPTKVVELRSNIFDGCANLVSVDLHDGVKTIDQNAFRDCVKLATIAIPQGTTFIGYGAFRNCSSLTTVTLPKELYRMDSYAFDGCVNLKTVIAKMPTPTGIDEYVFCAETYAGKLVVPVSTLALYQEAYAWRNFQTIVEEEPANEGLMLVVNLKDGTHDYYLLAEKPYFVFSGNNLSTTKTESVVVYDRNDIKDFTFEYGSSNAINSLEANGNLFVCQTGDGTLQISGLIDGAPVSVYDVGGKLLQVFKAGLTGKCEVNLPSAKGIYVINIDNKKTIKIPRK